MPVEKTNPNQDEADEGVEVHLDEADGKAKETESNAGGTAKADSGDGGGQQQAPDDTSGKPVAAPGSDEELEQYSEGVKRRIAKLTGKMREAERQREAALEFAKSAKQQAEENAQRVKALEAYHLREWGERLKAQDILLRGSLARAIEAGDTQKQVEAQKALAELAMDQRTYASMEAQRQNAAGRAQQQPPQAPVQQQQVQQPPPMPDAKAQAWAARNTWFGQDEAMTVTAFAHHKRLVEEEGVDPTSDEYYKELDKRIREDFPQKFGKPVQTQNTVAPALRQPQQVNGAAKVNQPIKLSPSEVAIANKLGVPLKEYARQKLLRQQREG